MRTQAPKSITLVVAIILFLIGFLDLYVSDLGLPPNWAQLCLVISNVLLILGALVKGL